MRLKPFMGYAVKAWPEAAASVSQHHRWLPGIVSVSLFAFENCVLCKLWELAVFEFCVCELHRECVHEEEEPNQSSWNDDVGMREICLRVMKQRLRFTSALTLYCVCASVSKRLVCVLSHCGRKAECCTELCVVSVPVEPQCPLQATLRFKKNTHAHKSSAWRCSARLSHCDRFSKKQTKLSEGKKMK